MIEDIGENIVGPIMLNYIIWVLKNAEKRKIKVLYFLARDGYLLHKIACYLCDYYKINIECRYLYCSRMSLRMPTYGYIGSEAWDLLFIKSYKLSLNVILGRLQLSNIEKESVLKKAKINLNIDKNLTEAEFEDVKVKLKSCTYFSKLISKKSCIAFENIISYLRQEKVLCQKHIGIVDSGWTGSMQRSLRQILEKAGFNTNITGFYFGSFYNKHDKADGEYLNWYFDESSGFWRKVYFCNNVLEALLSAPHETTIGYQFTGSHWKPLLKSSLSKKSVYATIDVMDNACMNYIKKSTSNMDYMLWDNCIELKKSL